MTRALGISLFLPLFAFGLAACSPGVDDGRPTTVGSPEREPSGETMLPDPVTTGTNPLESTLAGRRSVRSFESEPISLSAAGQILWAAQGVTDTSRGLRTAPSAGATYPLETYLVVGSVTDLEPGVYRYEPGSHALALMVESDIRDDLASAALSQRFVAEAPMSVVISAVYDRTAARYGDRAERYVHIEAGHAAQNLALQSVALDLGTVPVGAFDDDRVAALLELPEDEAPLYILPVGHPRQ